MVYLLQRLNDNHRGLLTRWEAPEPWSLSDEMRKIPGVFTFNILLLIKQKVVFVDRRDETSLGQRVNDLMKSSCINRVLFKCCLTVPSSIFPLCLLLCINIDWHVDASCIWLYTVYVFCWKELLSVLRPGISFCYKTVSLLGYLLSLLCWNVQKLRPCADFKGWAWKREDRGRDAHTQRQEKKESVVWSWSVPECCPKDWSLNVPTCCDSRTQRETRTLSFLLLC